MPVLPPPARRSPSRPRCGVETIACDLLDGAALATLPRLPNIVFMAGRKFGAEGDLALTWAMNVHVPALVAQAFPDARIVSVKINAAKVIK